MDDAELVRLRGIITRARKAIAHHEHHEECGADLHADCGPTSHYPDGTMGGGWRCYGELPEGECRRMLLTNCTCGLSSLRAALEVERA